MKIRTVYLKVADMEAALSFWQGLLGFEPHKRFPDWSEFRCENINFGLLLLDSFTVAKDAANFVPVFQLSPAQRDQLKARALELGGSVILDIDAHPDGVSYVLADPFGNEFELTSFAD